MNHQFVMKTKIYFEDQAIQYLKKITGSHGFLVSDTIIEGLGYLGEAKGYLEGAGIKTTVFTDVRPDPDVKIIADGMQKFVESGADLLIAFGGGSVIDTAKAILYSARQYIEGRGDKFEKPLFIAIPSTSGTGSEVTDFSVITVRDEKICLVDEYIAPDIAVLDTESKKHLPPKVAVDTGIDVLVHAIEAYLSADATDFTDALAEKAICLVFEHLKILSRTPSDEGARKRLQNASCIAGIAFNNAGLGITHSLAHAFGGKFHISHGRSNALFMVEVLKYNANLGGEMNERVCEKLAYMASRLNLPCRTMREGCVSFIDGVGRLKREVGIEDSIQALGIERAVFEEAIERMAETALEDRCTRTNPIPPAVEQLGEIYRKAYYGENIYIR